MRRAILALCAGLILAALAPGVATAQRGEDWYRDVRPFLDRNTEEGARRARLWERFIRLRADVRTADRRGDIPLRDADHYYDRLDKVARFLRDDRHLSQSEYDRRRHDLDGVERDLHRSLDHRLSRDWRR
jgi:hypothetical protein